MNKLEISSFLKLYDVTPPKILLFDAPQPKKEEQEILQQISKLSGNEKANPLNVVLESWVNVLSEDISSKEVTFSKDKVLINGDIRNEAAEMIRDFIGDDKKKLMKFHDLWLGKFSDFIKQLHESDRKMTVDEAVVLAGNQFRISTNSAMRAMISVIR